VILTFDLSSLKSSLECVEFLSQKGITISHKLGARLLALNSAHVQFSPVVLEDARPGSALESFLLGTAFIDEARGWKLNSLNELVAGEGVREFLRILPEDDLIKCVSPLEEGKENLLPVRLSRSTELLTPTSISPHSLLSDRKFLEETTLTFLDSDDPALIIASLKKLTRAALLSGKEPLNLFRKAFSREKPEIWKATATTIREMVDQDLGALLEAFLAEGEGEKRKALFRTLLKDSRAKEDALRGEMALQLFLNLQGTKEFFIFLGDNRELLADLMTCYSPYIDELLSRILVAGPRSDADELYQLREFISSIARRDRDVSTRLLREAQKDNPTWQRIMALWMMIPLSPGVKEEQIILSSLIGLMTDTISEPATITMVKALLLKLLPLSLSALTPLYQGLAREFQLFYLEMMDHVYACARAECPLSEAMADILLEELNGTDRAGQRRIIRLKWIREESVQESLKNRIIDHLALVDVMIEEFSAHQEMPEGREILSLAHRMVPDIVPLSLLLLEEKEAAGEDPVDYIQFCARFIYHTAPLPSAPGVREIIAYLDRLTRGESTSAPAAIEGLGLIFSRIREKKTVITRFIQRVIERKALSFESRVKILCNLLMAPHGTPYSRELIESYLLSLLASEELHTTDLSFLLEELNRVLKAGRYLKKEQKLADILAKAIAFKLTQPTIHEIMHTERIIKEPSLFIARYEQSPWTWDEITQALFILLKLFQSVDTPHVTKVRILHLLSHLVRHYCASREEKLSTFYLNEVVLFRVLHEVLPSGREERLFDFVRGMTISLIELVQRGKEEILAHEDFQRFLVKTASFLGGDDAELQREIIKTLILAWRRGSPGAALLLKEARSEEWVSEKLRRLMDLVP
jgi:hypothetical protein